jgi:hypothetical protein
MPLIASDIYRAFSRLGKRLRLKDAPAFAGVSSDVVPTTDFDKLLAETAYELLTLTSHAASDAWYVVATVPGGKRWTIHAFDLQRKTGDYECTGIGLAGADATSQTDPVILESFSATNSYQSGLINSFPLDQGQTVVILLGTGTTGGNWALRIWRTEEDAY